MRNAELWGALLEELALQQNCQELLNGAWTGEYRAGGGRIFCGRGCRVCCSLAVNCTLTEAVALADSLTPAQAADVADYATTLRERTRGLSDMKEYLRMQRRAMGACPLLDADGACAVYALRPLSCRALLSTKENHWCGVDFAGLSSEQKQVFMASLDRSVVAFPLHYAASPQETGRELETRALALMQERFGFAIYGNLPVLLHLVLARGLAEAVPAGRSVTEALIAEAGFSHPFFVECVP